MVKKKSMGVHLEESVVNVLDSLCSSPELSDFFLSRSQLIDYVLYDLLVGKNDSKELLRKLRAAVIRNRKRIKSEI